MKRFLSRVLRSLVHSSKARPWLQKRGHSDRKLKASLGPAKMIIPVFLSDNDELLTEVPVTEETRCEDVVEFCCDARENSCHLTEVWRGHERVIPFDHPMLEHLQKWGQRRQEVKFYLRHQGPPAQVREKETRPVFHDTHKCVTTAPGSVAEPWSYVTNRLCELMGHFTTALPSPLNLSVTTAGRQASP
ncbi:apoptosis-stimulating of p53 protein 1-like [Hoplias malabaricus]|uniref:apoptosis-stimulating of p53 protein 1-like n=1 Tax=Hoplias malabaricus TaxID=27720 RepID=UPI0034636834